MMKVSNKLFLEGSRHGSRQDVFCRRIHNLCNVTLEDIDLALSHNNKRSGKLCLYHPCPKK